MKNYFIFLFLSVVTIFSSCKKDDPNDPGNTNNAACVQNNTGTLKISSGKSNPYYIYADNGYLGTVAPYGNSSYTVEAGTYSIKLEQKSGYVLYPTIYNYSVNVGRCSQTTLSF